MSSSVALAIISLFYTGHDKGKPTSNSFSNVFTI